jgi:2-polyprenyl-6-hydroxyphenyl methylase/3-demethylubiquinone-9 3-methyltransferase
MSAHPTPPDAAGRSVDPAEVAKFAALAGRWWDPDGPMAPLHRMNPLRLQIIRDRAKEHFATTGVRPLAGLRGVDLGCGAGLVSLPLARMGAAVTGVDAAAEAIGAGAAQAMGQAVPVAFRCTTAEALATEAPGQFDLVVALEILEHLADRRAFLQAATRLLAPGGLMVLSTINRTAQARAFALFAAERLLGWLEPGTHEYDKLITPAELAADLAAVAPDLAVEPPVGLNLNPVTRVWRQGPDVSINYMVMATRPKPLSAKAP